MPRPAPAILVLEEQGDGTGVLASVLKQMEEHHVAGSGTVDGGFLAGSLRLPEGEENTSVKNRQTHRWQVLHLYQP